MLIVGESAPNKNEHWYKYCAELLRLVYVKFKETSVITVTRHLGFLLNILKF